MTPDQILRREACLQKVLARNARSSKSTKRVLNKLEAALIEMDEPRPAPTPAPKPTAAEVIKAKTEAVVQWRWLMARKAELGRKGRLSSSEYSARMALITHLPAATPPLNAAPDADATEWKIFIASIAEAVRATAKL